MRYLIHHPLLTNPVVCKTSMDATVTLDALDSVPNPSKTGCVEEVPDESEGDS